MNRCEQFLPSEADGHLDELSRRQRNIPLGGRYRQVSLYITFMLLQEVFTWGNSDYIGRLGETRLPGRVQGIPLGVTIAKVSCPRLVNNGAHH